MGRILTSVVLTTQDAPFKVLLNQKVCFSNSMLLTQSRTSEADTKDALLKVQLEQKICFFKGYTLDVVKRVRYPPTLYWLYQMLCLMCSLTKRYVFHRVCSWRSLASLSLWRNLLKYWKVSCSCKPKKCYVTKYWAATFNIQSHHI